MKRLLVAITIVVLMIAALSVSMPVGAKDNPIFEASIVPGAYPTPSEANFDKGEAKVYADGSFVIKIEGAQANETYKLSVGRWIGTALGGSGVKWVILSEQLTTNSEGEGTVSGTLPSGTGERSLFALSDADNEEGTPGPNRYVSGFQVP